MSGFECELVRDTVIISCLFASNGPNVYKITFLENDIAGLIQSSKSMYQLFDDNYPVKVVLNSKFFVLLTMSPTNGRPRLLIYRFAENNGSNYLWAGLNYDNMSDRDLSDIDITLLSTDILLVTTNSKFVTPTLMRYFELKSLRIRPKVTDIKELAKINIKWNTLNSGNEMTLVPMSHLFLHKDEQISGSALKNTEWYHWVIMGVFFGLLYLGIYLKWTREKIRREKIEFNVLSYGASDKINLSFT